MVYVMLFIDMHDSAEDASLHVVPTADIPDNVKKVLRAQEHPLNIGVDEDGWRDRAEVATDDEEKQEEYSEECESYFEEVSTKYMDLTLLQNGAKVRYVVKRWYG